MTNKQSTHTPTPEDMYQADRLALNALKKRGDNHCFECGTEYTRQEYMGKIYTACPNTRCGEFDYPVPVGGESITQTEVRS